MVGESIVNIAEDVSLPVSAIHDKLLIWQNELGSVWASAIALASLKALQMILFDND